MATFIERAITDMRKVGWPESDYKGSYAPNDEDLWGRSPGTMTSRAQLSQGAWPGKTYDGNICDSWTPLNPDWDNVKGATTSMMYANWSAITWWNQIYLGSVSRDGFITNGPGGNTNTRLMIWDPAIWVQYRDTGLWELLWTRRTFGGNAFDPEFDQDNGGFDVNGGSASGAVDVRVESNGYLSFRLVRGSLNGKTPQLANYWIMHGWAGSEQTFRGGPNNVKNVLIMQYASLVPHDSSKADDRAAARYLLSVGADYKPSSPVNGWWPAVGSAKHRIIRARWPEWEVQFCHTLRESEIRAGNFPPPLKGLAENLGGAAPAPAPAPAPSPAPAPAPAPAPSPAPVSNDWPVMTTPPAGGSAYVLASMDQPGWKTWSVEPRSAPPYIPTTARRTVISRASDFSEWGGSVDAQLARPFYSRRSIWTADGKYAFAQFLNSSDSTESGGVPMLDGETLAYIKRVTAFSYDHRLHPSNGDLVIYPSTNKYRAYSIASDSSTDFFTFSGYTAVDGSTGMFGDEGSPSKDGRYWIGCCTGGAGPDLVCVDVIANSVVSTIQLPVGWGYDQIQASPLNWWSMSRNGTYIITQSLASWTTRGGTSVPAGLNIWSRAGSLLRSFTGSGYAFHMDMGIDTSGEEVAVMVGNEGSIAGLSARAVKTLRFSDTTMTPRLETPAGLVREAWHTACPMLADGWAIVSSFGDDSGMSTAQQGALFNTIFAVRLDGSQRVGVIANVRHPRNDSADMSYNYETHACAHPLMTAVAWTSVWSYESSGSRRASHLYIAKGEGTTTAPPPPAPPPPPSNTPVWPGFSPPGKYASLLSNAKANYVLTQASTAGAPVISTVSIPGTRIGASFLYLLEATGRAPITWSVIVGTLPAGLTLNPVTGMLSGVVAATAVTSTFTVQASNGISPVATREFTLQIGSAPAFVGSLASGTVGVPYSQIVKPTGVPPFAFAINNGLLPPGLSAVPAVDWDVDVTGAAVRSALSTLSSYGYGPHNLLPHSEAFASWSRTEAWFLTNLILHSESLDKVEWTKSNATVQVNLTTRSESFGGGHWWVSEDGGSNPLLTLTNNVAAAPNATLTGGRVAENFLTGAKYAGLGSVSFVVGANYTFSIYAKADTARYIQIAAPSTGFGANAWASFDLSIGDVPARGSAVVTAGAESAGNGWYRCYIVVPATSATATSAHQIAMCDETNFSSRVPSYAGKGRHLFIWGAQTVYGVVPAPYTRTDGSAMPILHPGPTTEAAVANKIFSASGSYTYGGARGSVTVTSGKQYTFSAYVKNDGHSSVHLTPYNNNGRAVFDLVNGVAQTWAGTGGTPTATITNVGGGWWRCAITYTAVSSAGTSHEIGPRATYSDPSASLAHNGADGILVAGVQVVEGADPGLYQPTTTTSEVVRHYDPYGGRTAALAVASTAAASHFVYRNVVAASNKPVVVSLLVKKVSAIDKVTLYGHSTNPYAHFDLTLGTLLLKNSNVFDATITPVGDGWYRLTARYVDGVSKTFLAIRFSSGTYGTSSTAGDGTAGVLICRPQVNYGYMLTEYLPTVGLVTAGSLSPGYLVPGTANARLNASARSSVAMSRDANGVWGLALMNAIANSVCIGALSGTSGTLPTGWDGTSSGDGLSRTLTVGLDGDTPYLDVRFSGTPGASTFVSVNFAAINSVVARAGERWTLDVYASLAAGSFTNATPALSLLETDGSSGIVNNLLTFTPTNASLLSQRHRYSLELTSGSTTHVQPRIRVAITPGLPIDFTLRIALPQLYRGPVREEIVQTDGSVLYLPSIDYDPGVSDYVLQPEGARTNSVRNSACLGSTNAKPTNWSEVASSGLTFAYTTGVTLDGLPAVDVRITGTATTNNPQRLAFESATATVAATGEVWTGSFFAKLMDGSLGPSSAQVLIAERDSGGTWLDGGSATFTLDGTVRRASYTRTLNNVSTARVVHEFRITVVSGTTYDLTVRLACPQLELGEFASSPILTYGATATRATEIPVIPDSGAGWIGQDQGTIVVDAITAPGAGAVSQYQAALMGAGTDETIVMQRETDRSIRTSVIDGNVSQWGTTNILAAVNDSTALRHAVAYKANDFAHSLDGGAAQVDGAGTIPTMTQLVVGNTASGSRPWCGGIRRLRYRRVRLPNTTLVALSNGDDPLVGDGVRITGTPTAPGGWPFNVEATNDFGVGSQALQINVARIGGSAAPSPWTPWLRGR